MLVGQLCQTSYQSPLEKEEALLAWGASISRRFPQWADSRFTQVIYALLGSVAPSFFNEKSLTQLKKIVLAHYLLHKKEKVPGIYAKVFVDRPRLCLIVLFSGKKKAAPKELLVEACEQKIDTLWEVPFSHNQWHGCDPLFTFHYVEFEKLRGALPSRAEREEVRCYLEEKLGTHDTDTLFWPYNHEEAFKQIVGLAKEVSSRCDLPQVSLHFHKHEKQHIEFMVYMARPKRESPKQKFLQREDFPSSLTHISHVRKEIKSNLTCLVEAFSLKFSTKNFKKAGAINLLSAREYAGRILHNAIGVFRDYNGGLFESQKNAFQTLSAAFSSKVRYFSLFGEKLFYCLSPVEAQICLGLDVWKKLFTAFSQAIDTVPPFFRQMNSQIAILKTDHLEDLEAYSNQAKELCEQGKLQACAKIDFLSEHYLCLIGEQGKAFSKMFSPKIDHSQRTFRLTFEEPLPPSLDPYYLEMELRGRTIAKFLFEGLVRLDAKREVECAGCEEIRVSEEGKRYVFKLRESYWSNGEAVTAYHYEKAWKERFVRTERPTLFYFLKNAKKIKQGTVRNKHLGVKALDAHNLQVDLERPCREFLKHLTGPLFFPFLDKNSYKKAPLFNGAFVLDFKGKNQLIFKQNPYYLRQEFVYFSKVVLEFDCPSRKIRDQFKEGKVDWIGDPCTYCLEIPNPIVKNERSYPFLLFINCSKGPLSSRLIRQALSCGMNRENITASLFPGQTPLYSPLPEPLSTLKSSELLKEDRQRAKLLFAQGIEELGLAKKSIPPLVLTFFNREPFVSLAKYLKKSWSALFDIQIDLIILDWNKFYQKVGLHDYQICGFYQRIPGLEREIFLEKFYRANYGPKAALWKNKAYESVMQMLEQSLPNNERNALHSQAERILLNETPCIPLFARDILFSHHSGLTSYVVDYDGSVDFSLSQNKPT